MRQRPSPDDVVPEGLNVLNGSPLLSAEPLDPVCWDTFDANEIWNQVSRERRAATKGAAAPPPAREARREVQREEPRSNTAPPVPNEGSRWQRGVALPPSGEGSRRSNRYEEADNPEDLWDDPTAPQQGAAADFSAFGGSLDDEPLKAGAEGFDLSSMSEAAKAFEEDLRGEGKTNGHAGSVDGTQNNKKEPIRPLAAAGTTIRSGSGDDVNVFEDFGEPEEGAAAAGTEKTAIKSGDEQTPSSRLMQMIGVTNDDKEKETKEKDGEEKNESSTTTAASSIFGGFASSVPSNPWGAPPPAQSAPAPQPESLGLDLAAKLRETADQQSTGESEADRLKREEIETLRRREEEEEENRRKAAVAQQQAELHARQEAARQEQQQQQQQGQSQVERILTERISTILENSWGRSDLITVLQTLHSEDSRVIPLLGTVEALRALIVRHPMRFALGKDPTFGAEMAVLVMNNAAWQQQQQAAEDLQRRQQEEHQKMLAARQEAERAEAEARAHEAAKAQEEPVVITDSPWFYADPQGNVQGPFGGGEMRQWLEAGYFKGDLPISQNPEGQFRQLSSLFPEVALAFKPTAPSKKELAALAAAEMEAKAQAEVAQAEAREAEERERVEMEAKAKAEEEAFAASQAAEAAAAREEKEGKGAQNQSAQLKMLLGLGNGGGSIPVPAEEEVDEILTATSDEPIEQIPQSKPSKSKDTKKVSVSSNGSGPKVQVAGATPAPAAPPAWGGAGTSKPALKKKSMSEIQQEEAKVAAQVAKQRPQNSGGGWANIAASGGTTAWSGSASAIATAPASANMSTNSQGGANMKTAQQMAKGGVQKKTSKQNTSTQKTLEEFGANEKMSPALETWCKEQMRKLSGSEDLTLVAFCMTLSDPVEIKQYLTAYLGSTPQVNNFASEFINRKNGTKQQEQWETTSGSKKGRKKKGW